VLLTQFFNGDLKEVPETLVLRTETYTMVLIGIVALSFLIIALTRMSNGKALQTVLGVFFKGPSIEQQLKENMRMNSFSSVLLILNYFISFSLCLFILLNRILLVDGFWSTLLALGLPIVLFMMETLGLYVIAWVTGEQKSINNTVIITLTGYQFAGLLLSVLSLFWIMNPEYNRIFLGLFLSLICLRYITRLLKNSIAVLISGVSWYYLILYFCTLEILPLFVAYLYVSKNFLK
jgi:hypothetical protein